MKAQRKRYLRKTGKSLWLKSKFARKRALGFDVDSGSTGPSSSCINQHIELSNTTDSYHNVSEYIIVFHFFIFEFQNTNW